MKKETHYTELIKNFLDQNNINYQKIAPSMYMKSGQPDIQGTFENGKVFKIEVKRFNSKSYKASLLQKYQMLKAANNHEIVFFIDNENKFQQFCDYVINQKYKL